jgi:hypothetical protein
MKTKTKIRKRTETDWCCYLTPKSRLRRPEFSDDEWRLVSELADHLNVLYADSVGTAGALYGVGPKYSKPSIGIAIAAITIIAILKYRFTLRLLLRLRSSTKGGACTGFRTISWPKIIQAFWRIPIGSSKAEYAFVLPTRDAARRASDDAAPRRCMDFRRDPRSFPLTRAQSISSDGAAQPNNSGRRDPVCNNLRSPGRSCRITPY